MLMQFNKVSDQRAAELIEAWRASLVDMSEGFAAAIREGLCKYVIRGVIEQLDHHANEALRFEERCMIFYGYPEINAHISGHDRFRDSLIRLRCDLLCLRQTEALASYEFSVEMNRTIADWIMEHAKRDDNNLLQFLRGY